MLNTNLFADAGKSSVERLQSLAAEARQGAQQLAELNLQATKTTLAELVQLSQAVLSAKSPAEAAQLQAAALRAAPQKALAYSRQVKEILEAATASQRSAFEAQIVDVQAKFLEAVQGALKNAPGSENTVALVKSAVAAANNAYEGVNKASKQVTDALDANVAKIAEGAGSALATTEA
jgi:phasin family protein